MKEIAQLDAATKAELGLREFAPAGSPSFSTTEAGTEIGKIQPSGRRQRTICGRADETNPLQAFALNFKSLHAMNRGKLLEPLAAPVGFLGDMLDDIAEKTPHPKLVHHMDVRTDFACLGICRDFRFQTVFRIW